MKAIINQFQFPIPFSNMVAAGMEAIIRGREIRPEREEWYKLYLNSGHILP